MDDDRRRGNGVVEREGDAPFTVVGLDSDG
jgi:hypothetical protein